jgi:hypothetical protein
MNVGRGTVAPSLAINPALRLHRRALPAVLTWECHPESPRFGGVRDPLSAFGVHHREDANRVESGCV